MTSLKDKTVFITGATRGIGREIALRFARDGANIVVTGKTVESSAKVKGTIHETAEQVEQSGGRALALQLDIRDENAVVAAVKAAADRFGGIDVLVNNASAISMTGTMATPPKRYDLMHQIDARGTFICSQACIPLLAKAANPHILTLSPPLNMNPKWFRDHVAYTMAKYGMSMCTLGMSAELAPQGIAVNSLWPRTTIATAAVEVFFPEAVAGSRKPAIMADAAHAIVTRDSRSTTGNFYIDKEVLRSQGVGDFERYAVKPGTRLFNDLFLD
ncbi:MAG TPA: NAD(P)-dependent oxidoreductase [Burkholderiales bacterium]|nr:NAD(P)-dependent oxidoreductase [Burkholderiales bacterium]